MIEGIKAVAFDIDGTFYSEIKLYSRLIFYFIRHAAFFVKFSKVRRRLHQTAPLPDFFEYQARLLASIMKIPIEDAKDQINSVCYEGLKPYFKKIKPYPFVYDTVCALKAAGLKLALLSDFPPEQKGSIWGIRSLCDVCIGSEESGALKPSKYPFGILALKLNLKPEEILYVGNSKKYDVGGANNFGMKSAYLLKGFRKWFNIPLKEATISFRNYRELRNIILH